MPDPVSVTFRDQTTGRINDLLIDEHKACAPSQNLLGYLAGALLNYKDEGAELSPSIVLCDSIAGVLRAFPGGIAHHVGRASLDAASGPKILKDCAPLSGDNWYVFVERTDDLQVSYGVFTYFRLPTAIPLHEGITINRDEFCVLVRRVSTNTIEMRGAKGNILSLIFSTIREPLNSSSPIERFSKKCVSGISNPKISVDFGSYFSRLLESSLTSSHGTILLCGENIVLSEIPEMQDAVPVTPALDFQAAFLEFQTANSAGSILGLQRCEELLQGFLRCDGMIVFDTQARVTAYRVFFRPTGEAKIQSGQGEIVGGARRRAYEAVKEFVGKQLTSALFRSQDGLTLQHEVDE
jgi:hypothetical protein